MENVKLRTMTAKSKFDDGKYHGWTVQTLLDLKYFGYLKWVYFNMEKVSFNEDVLIQLGLTEAQRIAKPGVDKDLYKETLSYKYTESIESLRKRIKARIINGQPNTAYDLSKLKALEQNSKAKKINLASDIRYSKRSLQSRNHGH